MLVSSDISYVLCYPTARGNPATGPTKASQGDRQTIQKPTKLGHKSIQKSNKMEAKMVQNRSQEASWRGLGGSWGHLGSKMAPRSKKPPKINFWAPLLGGMLGPKISKIVPKSDPEGDDFFIVLGIDFWSHFVPTWLQLGSQNPPKMEPSWFQNRCKFGC